MDRSVTFSIGEAAKASELSVKAIRYYEEIGLIPKADRTDGGLHTSGHRVYTAADVRRLRLINHARLLGLSLADIRQILAVADGRGCLSRQPEYQQILKKHLADIDQRIGHLMGLRTAIQDLMAPRREPAKASCTLDTCGCMQPAQKVPSAAVSSPVKLHKSGGHRV